ncbi:MAG TPA: hypothetical protein VHX59_14240 [Mycobacteriales bacterium]|jgi:hypothetical protein|nr:hypothetical protein [Mycobacteriales bacterium]
MNRTLRAGLAVTATVAAGAAILVVLTGGTSRHNVPAPVSVRTVPAAAEQPVVVSAHRSPYAGTTVTGYLTGYADGAIRFRTASWVGGGLDDGHFEVGKLTHSLPLAATPTVRSAVSICSGGQVTLDRNANPTKACTTAQLVKALRSGIHPYASLRVDGSGRISAVLERYVP